MASAPVLTCSQLVRAMARNLVFAHIVSPASRSFFSSAL